jgi:hypothetical protein|tara:strand:+ start:18 stop:233 length:216 start_codon:yes stop_codon:yes gene_type:complete
MAKNKFKKTSMKKKITGGGASIAAPDLLFNQGQGIMEFGQALLPFLFKDGGKVRGCGIAKRGFGKAMKRKK